MQGFNFLLLNEDGAPANHGRVVEKLTDSHWLCQYVRTPSFCRVVGLPEIQTWLLFPTDKALNNYISAISAPLQMDPVVSPGKPEDGVFCEDEDFDAETDNP